MTQNTNNSMQGLINTLQEKYGYNQQEGAEAARNLIGFFECLIDIDRKQRGNHDLQLISPARPQEIEAAVNCARNPRVATNNGADTESGGGERKGSKRQTHRTKDEQQAGGGQAQD